MSKFYVGDVGTIIEVDVVEIITSGVVFELHVKRPDETTVEWTGSLYDTTKIRYTGQAGDFAQAGTHWLHAFVQKAGGERWYGDMVPYTLYEKWE
jgi:hypothetical protein